MSDTASARGPRIPARTVNMTDTVPAQAKDLREHDNISDGVHVEEAQEPASTTTIATAETFKPSRQIKQIVIAQILVLFAISLDMTILTATLMDVGQALNADTVATFWIAASYLLANAVVQPLMASFADIFGRRAVIFMAMCLFTLGSIICCAASDVPTMLAGRTSQGMGGGGVLAVNLIIISDLIPLRVRPSYIAAQQLFMSIGLNFAPIIGGGIVEHTTWRWLFYINFPFCLVGLLIIPFAIKYEEPRSSMLEKLRSIDWLGSLAFVAGMTTFLIGITWGGTQFPWASAATLVPLTIGLALVIATGYYEHRIATKTFLRLTLFNTWSAIAVYLCTILQGLTLFAQVYFLTLWLIAVKSYTPLTAGICLLAFSMVCIPSSGIIGPAVTRLGTYRWAIWTGWLITTLSLGLLILLDVDTPTAVWIIIFLVAGIGQGMIFMAHSIAAQAECHQDDAAHAMCMYSFMRSLGLCLGVSVGGTIWSNFLQRRTAELDLPADFPLTGEAAVYFAHNLLYNRVLREEIDAAFAWAFQMLFATLCGISGVGFIAACILIKGRSLDRELQTEHRLIETASGGSRNAPLLGTTSAAMSEAQPQRDIEAVV